MTDLDQINKCLAGRKEAYEPLVAKYKNLVYSIALNVLNRKDDASDATQEVFIKAWVSLNRFDAQYSFKTWIARIAVNHCINMNNKNKHDLAWDEDQMSRLTSDSGYPEEEILQRERVDTVRKAVSGLPEMYRLFITLFHEQSLTYDEICKITGQPLSIVKNRLYRARKMLAEKLVKAGFGTPEKEAAAWNA